MTAAFSILATLAIALWFYQSAQKGGLPGVAWAVAGVIVYYGGFLGWMYGVLRPLMGSGFMTHSLWIGIGMDVSAILAGLGAAAIFRAKILLTRQPVS